MKNDDRYKVLWEESNGDYPSYLKKVWKESSGYGRFGFVIASPMIIPIGIALKIIQSRIEA